MQQSGGLLRVGVSADATFIFCRRQKMQASPFWRVSTHESTTGVERELLRVGVSADAAFIFAAGKNASESILAQIAGRARRIKCGAGKDG